MANELAKAELNMSEKPSKWEERFILKRYDLDDIEISLSTRDILLKAMDDDVRRFQIGKTTVIIGSIKAIEPKWGKDNIPPRPKPKHEYEAKPDGMMYEKTTNQDELDEWDRLFKDKLATKFINK